MLHGKIKNIERAMLDKMSNLFDVSPVWLLGFTDDINCTIGKS